ncbi:hypothetical protein ACJX0J_026137, partial [Zea mays]
EYRLFNPARATLWLDISLSILLCYVGHKCLYEYFIDRLPNGTFIDGIDILGTVHAYVIHAQIAFRACTKKGFFNLSMLRLLKHLKEGMGSSTRKPFTFYSKAKNGSLYMKFTHKVQLRENVDNKLDKLEIHTKYYFKFNLYMFYKTNQKITQSICCIVFYKICNFSLNYVISLNYRTDVFSKQIDDKIYINYQNKSVVFLPWIQTGPISLSG